INSLTDLLAKDATSTDPGRVINVSSVASISVSAADSRLAGEGHGLWSCEFSLESEKGRLSLTIRIPQTILLKRQ
ncbi:6854_t:CDS:1, partial [Acaulospora colombiana]